MNTLNTLTVVTSWGQRICFIDARESYLVQIARQFSGAQSWQITNPDGAVIIEQLMPYSLREQAS